MSFITAKAMLDPVKIEAEVKKRIAWHWKSYAVACLVYQVCEGFVAKKITKRIETKVKETQGMDEYTVYYDTDHGMYNLTIWGNGIEYDSRVRLLLGYQSEGGMINMERLKDHFAGHFMDKGRAEKLTEGLKELRTIIALFNLRLEALQDTIKHAEEFGLKYFLDSGERY